MKVSIFSAFYPFRGGIAQFNARLFRSLQKDHEVSAFTFKKQYPDFLFPGTTQYVTENDKADKIPAQRVVSSFNPFTYCSAARKVKRSEPDVLILNFWMTIFGPFLGIMSSRQRPQTKRIALVHNLIPHEKRFFDSILTRFFVNRVDGFVVLSESVGKDLQEMKPDARVICLPHPWYDHFGEKMDKVNARKTLSILPDKKTLLFFGLVRDYKGLDVLIDAFEGLDESYQLVIAGEVYSGKEKYLDQSGRSAAKERIFFFDRYIPDDEVPILYSAADVCVLPYRSATQSGVTAASFHFEVPVIATNVGGLKESVGDKGLGNIVEEADPSLLRQAIIDFYTDGKAEAFVSNIRAEKQNNSWDHFATELIRFAKSI